MSQPATSTQNGHNPSTAPAIHASQPQPQPQPQTQGPRRPPNIPSKVLTGTYYSQPPQGHAAAPPGAPRSTPTHSHLPPASRYGPASGVLANKHPPHATQPRPSLPSAPQQHYRPASGGVPPPSARPIFPHSPVRSILNAGSSQHPAVRAPASVLGPGSRPLAPIPGNPTYQRSGSGPHLPLKPQEPRSFPGLPSSRPEPPAQQQPASTAPPPSSSQALPSAPQASGQAGQAPADPSPGVQQAAGTAQPRLDPSKARISDLIVPTAGQPGAVELLSGAQPGEVPVVCGGNRGRFLLAANQVACQCSKCVELAKDAGIPYTIMSMGEFEKHSRAPPCGPLLLTWLAVGLHCHRRGLRADRNLMVQQGLSTRVASVFGVEHPVPRASCFSWVAALGPQVIKRVVPEVGCLLYHCLAQMRPFHRSKWLQA